jgi:hypothetical protein
VGEAKFHVIRDFARWDRCHALVTKPSGCVLRPPRGVVGCQLRVTADLAATGDGRSISRDGAATPLRSQLTPPSRAAGMSRIDDVDTVNRKISFTEQVLTHVTAGADHDGGGGC